MKVLLDENFPLGLVRVLQADGLHVEHIITLNDFLFGTSVDATIIVSRVRQSRLLADRIDVWRKAIASVAAAAQTTRVFELTDEGVLEPWLGTPGR